MFAAGCARRQEPAVIYLSCGLQQYTLRHEPAVIYLSCGLQWRASRVDSGKSVENQLVTERNRHDTGRSLSFFCRADYTEASKSKQT